MNKLKRNLFIAIAVLQISVLAFMIVKQEYILNSPVKVLLKCEPIDPRSLFSGDYVILNYNISRINLSSVVLLTDEDRSLKSNDIVYVALKADENNKFHVPASVSKDRKLLRQKYNVIIKGTVISNYGTLSIRYGVENYFVPQNQGRMVEKNLNDVSVEAALTDDGESAISRLFIKDEEVVFY